MDDLAERLPRRIPPDAFAELEPRTINNLGGNALIFKRVSYDNAESYFTGWYNPDAESQSRDTRRWAAECRCTSCQNSFYLGWRSVKSKDIPGARTPGVIMGAFEDGSTVDGFVGVPGVADDDSEFAHAYDDGDMIDCPMCQRTVTLKHYSHFRAYGGWRVKTYQVMWGTVHNVGDLTALVFWLAVRTVSADANTSFAVNPQYAIVIDTKLRYFIYKDGGWRERPNIADPCQRFYYSAEAAFYKKVGAFFAKKNIPNQNGMSGEKTGIAEYIRNGGEFAYLYLKFWRAFPQIENLVKAGWTYTINHALDAETYAALNCGNRVTFSQSLQELCDWNETSPAKMLSMTRPEVRAAAWEMWHSETLTLWTDGAASGAFQPGGARQFFDDVIRFGVELLRDWLRSRAQGDNVPLDRLRRYLDKQIRLYNFAPTTAFRMFLDYRDMLRQIDAAAGRPADNVELFPKNLKDAHDRASLQCAALKSTIDAQKFIDVLKTWQALEYSDGDICARLPRSESELIQEGRTLHICIGSYGNQHLSGRLVIFIRRARRPERSYYALNIDVTGREPRRIQLHGYQNEFAHGKQLRIPQKVRDFCDRLENKILPPVFAAVRARQKGAAV